MPQRFDGEWKGDDRPRIYSSPGQPPYTVVPGDIIDADDPPDWRWTTIKAKATKLPDNVITDGTNPDMTVSEENAGLLAQRSPTALADSTGVLPDTAAAAAASPAGGPHSK